MEGSNANYFFPLLGHLALLTLAFSWKTFVNVLDELRNGLHEDYLLKYRAEANSLSKR